MTTDVADDTVELRGRVGRLAKKARAVWDAAHGLLSGCTRRQQRRPQRTEVCWLVRSITYEHEPSM
jgi:hypothetical protein